MAGNIVPAIASTNAIIAGAMAVEAIKYIDGRTESFRSVYYTPSRQFTSVRLSPPNPACLVCQAGVKEVVLSASCTLRHIIQLLQSDLKMEGTFEASVIESGRTLYDPDFDSNLAKSLPALSLEQDTVLTIIFDNSKLGILYAILTILEGSPKIITRHEGISLAVEEAQFEEADGLSAKKFKLSESADSNKMDNNLYDSDDDLILMN
jgi:ubiquitin-like 1-activating enzyme E1 B